MKLFDHLRLNHFSTFRVDWMGNVCMQFCSTFFVSIDAIFVEFGTALVAEARTEMIFTAAGGAMCGQLTTWHSHERTVRPLDNFQVSNYKTMIKCNGTKGFEPIGPFFDEFDTNLCNFHDLPPVEHFHKSSYRTLLTANT